MQIKGHSAIVTGGGSGLGEATTRHLAANGAKVAIFDINAENAERVAKDIGGTPVICDVADPASVEAAFKAVEAAVGPARILVNCAGVGTPHLLVTRDGNPMPFDTFADVVRINLLGTFNCMRCGAAAMAKLDALEDEERGVIINTASIAAFDGQIGQMAYAASKGGVVGMTLPAARELARHGVRVVTIAPGYFHTPLFDSTTVDFQQQLISSQVFPNTRIGKPAEYAKLCETIIDNVMLNGETIRIDAATRMPPR